MGRLSDVSIVRLQQALADVDGSVPAMRLIAAIAYKRGVSQTELAEWFDVERKTIYNWMKRFENAPRSLAKAAQDSPRPGRPPQIRDTG